MLYLEWFSERNGRVVVELPDAEISIQFASAKSGSVLDDPGGYENGMIIAILKRAMTGIHKAIDLAGKEEVAKAIPEIIEAVREELFIVREELLQEMEGLRK